MQKKKALGITDASYIKRFASHINHISRMKKMEEMLPSGRKALDIACSYGILTERIAGKGNDVIGIDTDRRALALLKKKGLKGIYGTAENLPFKAGSFDLVVAGEIIEHIRQPQKFMDEARRVLRKGGELIISTPNIASLSNRLRRSLGMRLNVVEYGGEHDVGHVSFFDRERLLKLLERNGFELEELRANYVYVPVLRLSSMLLGDLMPGLGVCLIARARKVK